MNKLILLLTVLILLLTACASTSKPTSNESQDLDSLSLSPNQNRQALLDHVLSGGPPPDGIPSIDEGVFESVEKADQWLEDFDQVFLYESEDKVYLFPQRILVWHEIVNIHEGDQKFSLTYCPLTGSAICYFYPDGLNTSFGTSGKLINSNLLMYDRATDAYISQIDGVGLNNELKDVALKSAPVFWLDWSLAKLYFKEAFVLSKDTGFIRNYNEDPYGDYGSNGPSGYYLNDGTIFKPIYEDSNNFFTDKYSIIGVKQDDLRLALDPEIVRTNGSHNFDLGALKLQALYDENLDIVRLYYVQEDQDIDWIGNQLVSSTGDTWNLQGKRITASQDLEIPLYFEVMWFAWYAFYPETEVIR
ncbi:MAG: DUF3179 domain-containing protein [Bacillota bacterium]|nr:DUF3179 domain-containing protein [Bacillota bacterium]